MKALSIKQPWAWLICSGYKDIENRNWPARFRGRIYVHTGKLFDSDGYDLFTLRSYDPDSIIGEAIEALSSAHFDLGAIIGEVDITGCTFRFGDMNANLFSPWHEVGMWGFEFANPILYAKSIPCHGRLGFFEPELVKDAKQ